MSNEITAKAKAKGRATALKITKDPKAKAPAKEKKASGKLYGYLPIGGVIIDYDQKKHGDKDPGDVVT